MSKKILLYKETKLREHGGIHLTLIVARGGRSARKAHNIWAKAHKLKKYKKTFGGMCASSRHGALCITLRGDYLEHGIIAHEIFHCTHRVWEYLGAWFDLDNQEPFANLNGYLSKVVYRALKKAKLKIT